LTDVRPARGYLDGAPELRIVGIAVAGGFAVMSELDEDGAEWLAEMESRQDVGSSSAARPVAGAIGAASADGAEPTGTEPEMTPAV
jgi:hypothetical protein